MPIDVCIYVKEAKRDEWQLVQCSEVRRYTSAVHDGRQGELSLAIISRAKTKPARRLHDEPMNVHFLLVLIN